MLIPESQLPSDMHPSHEVLPPSCLVRFDQCTRGQSEKITLDQALTTVEAKVKVRYQSRSRVSSQGSRHDQGQVIQDTDRRVNTTPNHNCCWDKTLQEVGGFYSLPIKVL